MNLSPYHTALFVVGTSVMFAVLCVWVACIVFRQRNFIAWMVLVSSILWGAVAIGSMILAYHPYFIHPQMIESELAYQLSINLYYVGSFAKFTFLIGLLLHLQRRKLESDRIAHLEAILHERESTGGARP